MNLADCQRFRDQEIVIYIYAIIKYFDVYSDHSDLDNLHISEFCAMGHHMGGNRTVNGQTEEAIDFAPIGLQNRMT